MAGSIWFHWHAHPDALIGLAIVQGLYLFGVGPLRQRHGLAESVEPRQVATFTVGIMVIFVALLSPLHVLSDSYLFSAHMVQHVLLTLVAPPLLILGTPDWLVRRILRPDPLFIAARIVTHPIVAIVLFNIIFSLFHMPSLYNVSVTNHLVHIVEHLVFIGTALIMWWPLVSTMPELPRLSYPLQMVYLFGMSVAQIVVFGPVTFSQEPLYQWYVDAPRLWSLTALSDQQIGAVIMKVGGGVLFMTLLIVAFYRWYKSAEKDTEPEPDSRELSLQRH